MKVFAERLKSLRIAKGLTQEELASVLDILAQRIYQYENDIRSPKLQTLLNISSYFNVSTDYLLGKTDYSDSIQDAGEKLGLSKETAYNLLRLVSGITDDFIGNENFQKLIIAIDDYYLSGFYNPVDLLRSINADSHGVNVEPIRRVLEHGLEDAALSKIKKIVEIMVSEMKAKNDTIVAHVRKLPDSDELLMKAIEIDDE